MIQSSFTWAKKTKKNLRQSVLVFPQTLPLFLCCVFWLNVLGCDNERPHDLNEQDASMDSDGSENLLDAEIGVDAQQETDSGGEQDATVEPEPDAFVPTSCNFDYENTFVYSIPAPSPSPWQSPHADPSNNSDSSDFSDSSPGYVAHVEPAPKGTYRTTPADPIYKDPGDIVMPDYSDNMPLFDRGEEWTDTTRCYETPAGVMLLTEPEAYALYQDIAELTTGVTMDTSPGVRTVVGLRGAYPGRLLPHDNLPNRFNDTLVLLWLDENGMEHVREFPVNTDTGAYDFGYHSSSSLRPNRRYHYINGWHRTYNALHINEYDYLVWDDANKNGHWDSDRNGWLAPSSPEDHERTGGGHNIHMGSVNAPLGSAAINNWSAGCQVIPGMANWTEFITHAWTAEGDLVNYFLIDVRDIDHSVFFSCTPDGSHDCPYEITSFPYSHSDDTSLSPVDFFDLYNCSSSDESGPEVVYFFTVDEGGTLTVSVDDVDGDDIDVDVHLLDADDPDACLDRAHISFSTSIGPGRYFIIADTYVSEGQVFSGPYTLSVDFQ